MCIIIQFHNNLHIIIKKSEKCKKATCRMADGFLFKDQFDSGSISSFSSW